MELRDAERVWAKSLPLRRARHYLWSRRWMRAVLADLFAMSPEAVPLNAPPGQAPFLEDPWGFVSISHCPDALVVAWAPWRIVAESGEGLDVYAAIAGKEARGPRAWICEGAACRLPIREPEALSEALS